jgi:hypothetical protein
VSLCAQVTGKDKSGTVLKVEVVGQQSTGTRYKPMSSGMAEFSGSFMQTRNGLRKMKSLGVRVLEVKSLPKKDVTGKCDPYVTVSMGPVEYKTDVVKNTFDAFYNEFYTFDSQDGREIAPLVIQVWDWDRLSKSDLIGQVRAPALVAAAPPCAFATDFSERVCSLSPQVEYSVDKVNAMLDNYIGWSTGVSDCSLSKKGQVAITLRFPDPKPPARACPVSWLSCKTPDGAGRDRRRPQQECRDPRDFGPRDHPQARQGRHRAPPAAVPVPLLLMVVLVVVMMMMMMMIHLPLHT